MEYLEGRLLLSAVNNAGVSWSTYFGGSENEGADNPSDLAIDASGDKLMGGWTESSDLPDATNAYSGADVDGFVAKFDPSGNLLWTTYIGGSDTVEVYGVAVDSSGDSYVTGRSDAFDLPGALNSAIGGRDAFVAKLDPDGNILWSLYLGGSGEEQGQSIAVDGSGNAYITGWTQSGDFAGASGTYGGGTDAFLAKVDSDGNLQWATYFGGAGSDKSGEVAVNSAGETLIAGITGSKTLPNATNGYHGGSSDAFVAKFDASGSEQWATYLGGSGSEAFFGGSTGYLGGVAWDTDGSAAVTGYTQSSNLAKTRNKYGGGGDGFVSKVDASGQLLWSDYLGGGKTDVVTSVAFDGQHNIIATGGINFTSLTGTTMNIMVAKINPSGTVDFINQFGGSKNDAGGAVAVDSGGNVWITGGTWSSDFPAADNANPPGDPSQGPDEPYNAFLAEILASAMSQPTHLAVSTLPGTQDAGNLPTLSVQVEYASGAIVNNDSSTIMVTLLAANGATLGGMTAVQAINGVATFTGLMVDQVGSYRFAVSDMQDGLASASSGKFTVTADTTSAHLVLSPGASAAVVGHAFSPAIVVDEIDQFGNPVIADKARITLGVVAGPALTLSGKTTANLKKGAASFSKAIPTAAGNYTLSLTSANQAVAPLSFPQMVGQATTKVVIPHVATSYIYGQAIDLTARFTSDAPSSIGFTGTATLTDAGNDFMATGTLTSTGTVKFSLPVIPANATPYSVTISYPGDANHTAITSGAFPLLIKPAASKITLVPSATSLVSGQTLTLTATLSTPTDPSATHNGVVVFNDGQMPIQTLTLTGNTTAAYVFVPPAGLHTYTAAYINDGNFTSSSSHTQAIQVNLAPAPMQGDELLFSNLAGTDDQDPPGLDLDSFFPTGGTVAQGDLSYGGTKVYSYTYKQTGPFTATVIATTTSRPRQSVTVSLDFLTATSGTAALKYSSGDTGTSSFILLTSPIAANAPVTVAGATITLTATAGSALLGSSGSTQLSPSASDNSYTLLGISGSNVNSSGTYTYSQVNPAIAAFAYSDALGTGTIYLAFTSPTAGVYYNVNGTNDWQAGTFTLAAAAADNA